MNLEKLIIKAEILIFSFGLKMFYKSKKLQDIFAIIQFLLAIHLMKTLFLISEALTNFGGISKKILAQVEALKRLGFKVDLSYLKANDKNKNIGRYINNGIIDTYSKISIVSEFQWRCLYGNLYHYIKENEIQIVFIRYTHFANPFFLSFLKSLKRIISGS